MHRTHRAQPVAGGRRKCPRQTWRRPPRPRSRPGNRSARAGRASSSPRPPPPLPGYRKPRPRERRARTIPNAKAPGNSLPPCSTSRAAHAAEVPRSAPARHDRAPGPSREASRDRRPRAPLQRPSGAESALRTTGGDLRRKGPARVSHVRGHRARRTHGRPRAGRPRPVPGLPHRAPRAGRPRPSTRRAKRPSNR